MKSWIKLYTEILHDPKMGRLSDRQYRTCITLFLLAGQLDREGALPPVDDIAWHMRMEPTPLLDDMAALAAVGILTRDGDDWIVTRFADRQARQPSETPEEVKRRVTEHRQRKAQACNDDVTACNVSVTPCNDIEKKREEKKREEKTTPLQPPPLQSPPPPLLAQAMRAYECSIGLVAGPTQGDEMAAMVDELHAKKLDDWWTMAVKVACDQNHRSWAYVRGILRNCLRDGKPPGAPKQNGNGNARASPRRGSDWTPAELAAGRQADEGEAWPQPI